MRNDGSPFGYTPVKPKDPGVRIHRGDRMLWLGSCFVDALHPFLRQYQYNVLVNPFGTVFHPLVLGQLLEQTPTQLERYTFEKEGVWQNYALGTPFISDSSTALHKKIEDVGGSVKTHLSSCKWLVMTWGTAFFYEHKELGMIGKCHKQPSGWFTKKRSRPEEISRFWIDRITRLRETNPDLNVLLTLSPVRHTRDGLEENSVSKASLRLAIEEIRNAIPGVFYFPAYEIVMDELRDYRFFSNDFIHPNAEAVQYIWDRFSNQFLVPVENKVNALISELFHLENHKPFATYGKEYTRWQAAIEQKKADIKSLLANESAFL